jgi:hypothetical protein
LALYGAEELSRVEWFEEAWRTAPRHARPQTCVAEVDVEAEDQRKFRGSQLRLAAPTGTAKGTMRQLFE